MCVLLYLFHFYPSPNPLTSPMFPTPSQILSFFYDYCFPHTLLSPLYDSHMYISLGLTTYKWITYWGKED